MAKKEVEGCCGRIEASTPTATSSSSSSNSGSGSAANLVKRNEAVGIISAQWAVGDLASTDQEIINEQQPHPSIDHSSSYITTTAPSLPPTTKTKKGKVALIMLLFEVFSVMNLCRILYIYFLLCFCPRVFD